MSVVTDIGLVFSAAGRPEFISTLFIGSWAVSGVLVVVGVPGGAWPLPGSMTTVFTGGWAGFSVFSSISAGGSSIFGRSSLTLGRTDFLSADAARPRGLQISECLGAALTQPSRLTQPLSWC